MLRRIRKRSRADTHSNQPRIIRKSRGRVVYLACLALLGLALLNHLWGERILVKIDGLVLRERDLIAATSVSRIDEVYVRPGQPVAQGQMLLQSSSLQLLDSIAEYTVRNAELVERESALRSRMLVVDRLLPLSEVRLRDAQASLSSSKTLSEQGLIGTARLDEVAQIAYAAEKEAVELAVEKSTLALEVAAVSRARQAAEVALRKLENHYSDGVVRAETAGTIGDVVPSVGEVFVAGEPILSIISGRPYVLAYLPEDYLFSLNEGLEVNISGGRKAATGYISEVLPVAQAVPQEFKNAFKPYRNRQLARIEFHRDPPIPTFSNVRITQGPTEAVVEMAQTFRETDWVAASGWLGKGWSETDPD